LLPTKPRNGSHVAGGEQPWSTRKPFEIGDLTLHVEPGVGRGSTTGRRKRLKHLPTQDLRPPNDEFKDAVRMPLRLHHGNGELVPVRPSLPGMNDREQIALRMGPRPSVRIQDINAAGRRRIPAGAQHEEPKEHRGLGAAGDEPADRAGHSVGETFVHRRRQVSGAGTALQQSRRTFTIEPRTVRNPALQKRPDQEGAVLRQIPAAVLARIRAGRSQALALGKHCLDLTAFVLQRVV
jgi:hypothetical protein